jgi:molybdopterin-binding protein
LHQAGDDLAAHVRVRGVVRSIRSHGIKTLVELQAGPFEITAIVTRDTLRRQELVEGAEAIVTIRATAVLIERAGPLSDAAGSRLAGAAKVHYTSSLGPIT